MQCRYWPRVCTPVRVRHVSRERPASACRASCAHSASITARKRGCEHRACHPCYGSCGCANRLRHPPPRKSPHAHALPASLIQCSVPQDPASHLRSSQRPQPRCAQARPDRKEGRGDRCVSMGGSKSNVAARNTRACVPPYRGACRRNTRTHTHTRARARTPHTHTHALSLPSLSLCLSRSLSYLYLDSFTHGSTSSRAPARHSLSVTYGRTVGWKHLHAPNLGHLALLSL